MVNLSLELSNISIFINKFQEDRIYIDEHIKWIESYAIAMLYSYHEKGNKVELQSIERNVENYIHTILYGKSTCLSTYIPIIQLSQKSPDEITSNICYKISDKLTNISDEDRRDLIEYLKYAISEMVDNVLSHANSSGYDYVIAQYFPSTKKIQVAIVDTGIGFKNAMHRMHSLKTEAEAIEHALQMCVTGSNIYDPYGALKHAGLGLYFLRRIIEETKGNLTIVSNNTIYEICNGIKTNLYTVDTSWKGSVVIFELFLDKLEYEWKQIQKIIQNEVAGISFEEGSEAVFSF